MPSSAHDAQRYVQVASVKLFAMLEEIPMVVFGAFAQTAARQLIDAYDLLIRLCTRIAYLCGFLAAGLLLYSVVVRGKPL